ncbi:asparaginase [Candidatus Micrarchaeota archaeon]|nr:asparaginase [Candidatus Micrarchaeota archaeon]
MATRLFITGGTIDGFDCSDPGSPSLYESSRVPALLTRARLSGLIPFETIVFKDGRSITEEDREAILKKCRDCGEDKIIITHGTSTLTDTAKFLGRAKLPKTIVLLGAAVPAEERDSDALFNLGAAFAAVQFLRHGVYITMNGRAFPWQNVRKNIKTGMFEAETGE